MYDRALPNPKPLPVSSSYFQERLDTLVGVTGARMAKYRATWKETAIIWFRLAWRPHVFGILLFEVCSCA